MTKLQLFRHGQTVWNILGKLQGQQDSPLSELGRKQAHDAAEKLAGEDISAAYSSSSPRAVRTTQILLGARDLPIRQMDQLREINLGVWEGKHKEEVCRRFPVEYQAFWERPNHYQTVDGETFHELHPRARVLHHGPARNQRLDAGGPRNASRPRRCQRHRLPRAGRDGAKLVRQGRDPPIGLKSSE